jgi:predicted Zn-dependent protease
MMFSNASLAPQAAKLFDEVKEKETPHKSSAVNNYVRCVANPVIDIATAQYSSLPGSWEIVVFDNDAANAFAMPGGKIGVYSGLIDLTENQDQLAAVIGHEIAHVIAEHSAERMSTAQVVGLGMTAAGVAFSDNKNQRVIMTALGLGVMIGVQLPYSRVHEEEADQIGQELMARAGFNPAAAIELWYLMDKKAGTRPPEFLSTHPDPVSRAGRLKRLLPGSLPYYQAVVDRGGVPHCDEPKKPVTTKKHKDQDE